MYDVIVIGAGLFGSIIAESLIQQGRNVCVIDAEKENSGSKPAACLMKPSWYSGLGKEITTPALDTLDKLYGLESVEFNVRGVKVPVHWIPPAKILKKNYIKGEVCAVDKNIHDSWSVELQGSKLKGVMYAKNIVIAAGIWAKKFCEIEGGLSGQAGIAFLWENGDLKTPFITPYAPYRQMVAFNRGDGLWMSDGTAIKEENWTKERESAAFQRCTKALGWPPQHPQRIYGVRPYSKMKPCYLKEVDKGCWVATGGAKNGTIAAGWCAHIISGELK